MVSSILPEDGSLGGTFINGIFILIPLAVCYMSFYLGKTHVQRQMRRELRLQA